MKELILNQHLTDAIDGALVAENNAETKRGHLGMSTIGDPDERTLWLQFRWCLPNDFTGRVLRIFELGHVVEDLIIKNLEAAGCKVWPVDPSTGKQFNFKRVGGHYAGSADGVVLFNGVIASKLPHVLECKSAKNSIFNTFKKDGVQKTEPKYFNQCQNYMRELNLTRAIIIIYNKDTSALYYERIKYDEIVAIANEAKAERIITDQWFLPESDFPSPDFYKIKKFKSETYQRIYWGKQLPPMNCRNCQNACPLVGNLSSATWLCDTHDKELTIDEQMVGCSEHLYISEMMPAKLVRFHEDHNAVEYITEDGFTFFNAGSEASGPAFQSGELEQLSRVGLNKENMSEDFMQDLRQQFGGVLTELAPIQGVI